MLVITKFLEENMQLQTDTDAMDQNKDKEDSWFKKKVVNPSKKIGDAALEIGNHISQPLFYIGATMKNPHMQIAGTLLPTVNAIRKQFKAG